jgi:hypothetical protein
VVCHHSRASSLPQLHHSRASSLPRGGGSAVEWQRYAGVVVLDMLAERKLHTAALVSHRFAIGEAAKAYETILGDEPSLGVLLQYPDGPVEAIRNGAPSPIPFDEIVEVARVSIEVAEAAR